MQLCLLLPLTIFLQQTPSSNGRRKVFWREVCSGLVFRKTFLLFLPPFYTFSTRANASSLPVFTPKLLPVVNTRAHARTRADGARVRGEKLTLKLLLMTQIILDRAFNPQNKYFRCSSAPYRARSRPPFRLVGTRFTTRDSCPPFSSGDAGRRLTTGGHSGTPVIRRVGSRQQPDRKRPGLAKQHRRPSGGVGREQ